MTTTRCWSLEECPARYTADVIEGKWKPLIVYLLKDGPLRYGELRRRMIGVSKKMLTQQIRELERDEIVDRRVHSADLLHVEYALTEHGRELEEVLKTMAEWGAAHRARRTACASAGPPPTTEEHYSQVAETAVASGK
jgi:DNA-binding HxlR family transcriptional regulator